MKENKHRNTRSWNPFVGCGFGCAYCKPSFQNWIGRLGTWHHCEGCQQYAPHEHPERLSRLYRDKTIFVCEDGDIAFARPEYMARIFDVIRADQKKRNWLLQSKNPKCFEQYLSLLPENTYLITTLETNRDITKLISKAPDTSIRLRDFKALDWDRKFVTVEPIMDFDFDEFAQQIVSIKPLCVFIGYNSKPKKVQIPEPSKEKTLALIRKLESEDIRVLTKEMRDPNMIHYQYRDYFEE